MKLAYEIFSSALYIIPEFIKRAVALYKIMEKHVL
jgi:hypothetical protein